MSGATFPKPLARNSVAGCSLCAVLFRSVDDFDAHLPCGSVAVPATATEIVPVSKPVVPRRVASVRKTRPSLPSMSEIFRIC